MQARMGAGPGFPSVEIAMLPAHPIRREVRNGKACTASAGSAVALVGCGRSSAPVFRFRSRRPGAEAPPRRSSDQPGRCSAPDSQPSTAPDQSASQPPSTTPQTPEPDSTATAPEPDQGESPHHHADVMRHGSEAMGFSQEATAHKFVLTRGGGVIRITVNDPDDVETAQHIGMHLRDAASQFARGDFSAPLHTHGQAPPGTPVMRQLRGKITYTAHPIQDGAELIISSEDAKAVEAIHQFLQFQIRDHQTGDSAAIR